MTSSVNGESKLDLQEENMKPTQQLHNRGQRLWLDNITRALLTSGTLRSYIDDLSVTGLTSNPSIFDVAIKDSNLYDDAIRQKTKEGKSGEILFFELAIDDLRQAADLFRPVHDGTGGLDGWVSLEVSPLLAYDAASTVKEAVQLKARAQRPNLFIKIPGTSEGRAAIEDAIFAGVPVNVTLLFSSGQYIAAAEAYLRGIERRIAAGLDPKVRSVASMFVSRWDKAVMGKVPKIFKTVWALRSRSVLTKLTGISSLHRAGRKPLLLALSHSACSGRARAQKTQTHPMYFTSRRSVPRTPSIRFPRRRCSRSPITVHRVNSCR
jgi:transaldolase